MGFLKQGYKAFEFSLMRGLHKGVGEGLGKGWGKGWGGLRVACGLGGGLDILHSNNPVCKNRINVP